RPRPARSAPRDGPATLGPSDRPPVATVSTTPRPVRQRDRPRHQWPYSFHLPVVRGRSPLHGSGVHIPRPSPTSGGLDNFGTDVRSYRNHGTHVPIIVKEVHRASASLDTKQDRHLVVRSMQ